MYRRFRLAFITLRFPALVCSLLFLLLLLFVIVDLDAFVVVIPDVYWCLLIGAGSVLSHAVFLISSIAHILGNICWSIYKGALLITTGCP